MDGNLVEALISVLRYGTVVGDDPHGGSDETRPSNSQTLLTQANVFSSRNGRPSFETWETQVGRGGRRRFKPACPD